jgi:hypothetical protein
VEQVVGSVWPSQKIRVRGDRIELEDIWSDRGSNRSRIAYRCIVVAGINEVERKDEKRSNDAFDR